MKENVQKVSSSYGFRRTDQYPMEDIIDGSR